MMRWIALFALLQCPQFQPVLFVGRRDDVYRERLFHGQRTALWHWTTCSGGPGVAHPGMLFSDGGAAVFDCRSFDKDGDCDVDLADFAVYARQLGALR